MRRFYLFVLFFMLVGVPVFATGDEDSLATQAMFDSVQARLNFQTGTIVLGEGTADLQVPEGFQYLDPEDSKFVLEQLWGNPPSENWGMLFPAGMMPMDEDSWAIVITFSEEGYVRDEDADDIDYDELLSDMQESTREASEIRAEQGYGTIELVGWASKPHYDAQSKKLHWAKELKFDSSEENTLNYNIRILGRKGVLVLNAIGSMNNLQDINTGVEPVLASVNFNEGHRYADFNPDIDQVAAYGVGGLIAGKVLAKTGILALILKNIKVIGLALVALFVALKRFVFGRKDESTETA